MAVRAPAPRAVLFDRDGTLVHDVPYNGDPERVEPVDGAREAVDRLRRNGIRVGVVTNQSGIARGLLHRRGRAPGGEADRGAARAVRHLAGLPARRRRRLRLPQTRAGHGPRAPRASSALRPEEVVVVGDIGRDVEAARAAGAYGILVPTPVTRAEEVRAAAAGAAAVVAPDLATAAGIVLDLARRPSAGRLAGNGGAP